MVQEKEQRKTWEFPWSYRESFMVALELLLLGLILQVLSGRSQFAGLHWPFNLAAGIAFTIVLLTVHFFFRRKPFVRWLSSVPAAISSITFFALLVLLLGFIPQQNPDTPRIIRILGLDSIRHSWLLMISGLYLLVCLGLVIIRRALPLTGKNLGFLLNHAGLWIILLSAALGTGDLRKVSIQLYEGQESTDIGIDQSGKEVRLPFSLMLLDFIIDEYPPEIGIGNPKTGEIVEESGSTLIRIREHEVYPIGKWIITVNKLITNAYPGIGGFSNLDSTGAAPAANVSVKNKLNDRTAEGWISCGSNTFSPAFLDLDEDYVLFMERPKPAKYASLLTMTREAETDTVSIEVNNPVHMKGYSVYQVSYDEHLGKWSQVSMLEAVKDPWLPVIYAGIIMVLAGSVYLFWKGNEIRKE